MDFRNAALTAFGAGWLFLFGGCENHPNTAFPTAQTVAAQASGGGAGIATLERGRKLYTTRCTECHVARAIDHYSVAQWQHYIGIMAPRAGLKPQDRAAVETYVIAARKSLPPD